ncbi:beta-ketoacyl-[acyl-carrier-protein] synthase family protein [Brenneria goodwinii]|uniref:beta-ketoacyl-[acyl-carrier-protein] synthase family protein n=1 Tax=Brenneria goodwinii TaxID=1109412 RepID=UPI000EF1B24E|nr:beta-ketoacyl-[acyl-carrier-protein] synthase family protein [Brenneria goodwinii]MCG8157368.1 beta-ketoacyl-[acyl-carrier-protein] synthase family protein [Brenneria goodwinii]MCG8163191.1 beta-ketoacyl-[acyl-carrier-protein] synthase family protein [Brenneria goodwinii]MCG8165182.1 beta-ketoacyl-[acyl-carrier-protein] synthase family protein [Brenneria goodwinii]MCG8170850.1 beta-ketoacyl-[acyl-carrier-protein] synthase family protein [Brenneria goodwinii]MCG8175949.1 beta-ketoacyl-[acyl-
MVYINAVGALNALGNNLDEIARNLAKVNAPGMRLDSGWLLQGKPCWTGNVDADLPLIPDELAEHNSRNNQLLLAALAQIRPQVDKAIALFGADRVAVILGTSTSGLDEADRYVSDNLPTYCYAQQELGDPSRFLAAYLNIDGPAYTISTACSSSARALISGRRLIDAGMVDVAIVGGADTLSRMPLNGFDSLESLSSQLCTPFGQQRDGITIGEGAALMLIGREPDDVALLGVGESSDAHHMSAPHPEGEGAIRAIEMALQQANLQPENIGYINLHGTATRLNDQIEANVIHAIFGDATPCSSTKYLTGHTLGAAGICEAVICWLLLTRDLPLPPQDFSRSAQDETLPPCGLLLEAGQLRQPVILSNSFAFGGNNACLILGKANG